MKGFGNIMKEAQKLQQQMAAMQEEIGKKRVEATAGGGMVTVEANGKQEIVSIKIDPEVVNRDDIQMLEDLVLAACNEALRKSRELMQQELAAHRRAQDSRPGDVGRTRLGVLSGPGRAAHRGAPAAARDRTEDGPAAHVLPAQAARRGGARALRVAPRREGPDRLLSPVLQHHRRGPLPHLRRSFARLAPALCRRGAERSLGDGANGRVPRALPRAARRALAAGRHRARRPQGQGAPGPARGRRHDRGDPRDEPQRRGGGDGALPAACPWAATSSTPTR